MARHKHPRSQRCQVSLKAKYRAGGARHHEGVVYNLREEGILPCTKEPLGAGTHLEISIWIPGVPKEVQAEGRVVWTNAVESETLPAGMGIHFTQVDEEGKARV